MPNAWITYVKKYSETNNVKYGDAMKEIKAKGLYKPAAKKPAAKKGNLKGAGFGKKLSRALKTPLVQKKKSVGKAVKKAVTKRKVKVTFGDVFNSLFGEGGSPNSVDDYKLLIRLADRQKDPKLTRQVDEYVLDHYTSQRADSSAEEDKMFRSLAGRGPKVPIKNY
jgi:hypothetical protein